MKRMFDRRTGRRWSRTVKPIASRHGFTLVELLVVIAIIGILVALLLPAIQAAREAARRTQCTNNLKQVGLGFQNYAVKNGTLPGGSSYLINDGKGTRTWVTELLPHIEEQALADRFSKTVYMDQAPNAEIAANALITAFICPSDPRAGAPIKRNVAGQPDEIRPPGTAGNHHPPVCQALWYTASMGPTIPDQCAFDTSPAACMGCDMGSPTMPWAAVCAPCSSNPRVPCPDKSKGVGMFARSIKGVQLRRVTDGLSHTIAAGETLPFDCIWNCLFCDNHPLTSTQIPLNNREADEPAVPLLRPWRSHGYKSEHPGGVNVVMGDGSVQFLEETIDHLIYNAMGTRAADEPINR
jgi:prepilin-type N-terminal cleavage/methylation domain-containing protein/prepilin-type processing-associated H-X9-DG protein